MIAHFKELAVKSFVDYQGEIKSTSKGVIPRRSADAVVHQPGFRADERIMRDSNSQEKVTTIEHNVTAKDHGLVNAISIPHLSDHFRQVLPVMSVAKSRNFWDGRRNQYYYYDSNHDDLVYQDGTRFKRRDSVLRTTLVAHATSQVAYAAPQQVQNPDPEPASARAQAQSAAPRHPSADQTSGMTLSAASKRQSEGQLDDLRGCEATVATTRQAQSGSQQGANQTVSRREAPDDSSRKNPHQAVPSGPLAHQESPRQGSQTQPQGSGDVNFTDSRNGISVSIKAGSPQDITDAALYREGGRAQRMLLGTAGDEEQLFPEFTKKSQPRNFFKFGKVFYTLWAEPAGETTTAISMLERGILPDRYKGEKIFSKVRRFVVIHEGETYCSAIPITMYGSRGVGKSGVNKSEHVVIYTGRQAPEPGKDESGMRKPAIRVDPDHRDGKLDRLSRLNLAQVFTVQHNLKVKSFGKVHKASQKPLRELTLAVWRGDAFPNCSNSNDDDLDSDDQADDQAGPVRKTTAQPSSKDAVQKSAQAIRAQAANSTSLKRQAPSREARAFHGQEDTIAALQRQQGFTREQALQALLRKSQLAEQSSKTMAGPSGAYQGSGARKQDEQDDDESEEDSEDESD